MIEYVVIAIALAGVGLIAWRQFGGFRPAEPYPLVVIPASVTLQPQPLLSDSDLLLYNVMRLAVEERYLVLARVPLLSVLQVEGEGPERTQVLRHLALKQLDFALVHPGSRIVEHAVLVERPQLDQREKMRLRNIRTIVQAAEIRLTTLKAGTSYTVQQLAELFDVMESE